MRAHGISPGARPTFLRYLNQKPKASVPVWRTGSLFLKYWCAKIFGIIILQGAPSNGVRNLGFDRIFFQIFLASPLQAVFPALLYITLERRSSARIFCGKHRFTA